MLFLYGFYVLGLPLYVLSNLMKVFLYALLARILSIRLLAYQNIYVSRLEYYIKLFRV